MTPDPLYPGSITDIAGIAVGLAACSGRPSGCTVLLFPAGTVGSGVARGAAPGTRETDQLRPENDMQVVRAVLLAGGSAFRGGRSRLLSFT
jgi:L-aminopeptidase/D-esterase-like protein